MLTTNFNSYLQVLEDLLAQIEHAACTLHAAVNQTYDTIHPYGYHLIKVANAVKAYGCSCIASQHDILPVIFAAYFHDSIEDARLTYNDVKQYALQYMDDNQALMAAEIVYALTNDKGRTRAERAGENYYKGIRSTMYAPMVKLADRLANMSYSFNKRNDANNRMYAVYVKEWSHFIASITSSETDIRYSLPEPMLDQFQPFFATRPIH